MTAFVFPRALAEIGAVAKGTPLSGQPFYWLTAVCARHLRFMVVTFSGRAEDRG
jgi:hypothetical protein